MDSRVEERDAPVVHVALRELHVAVAEYEVVRVRLVVREEVLLDDSPPGSPRQRMNSVCPQDAYHLMMCQRIGWLPIGIIGFGMR